MPTLDDTSSEDEVEIVKPPPLAGAKMDDVEATVDMVNPINKVKIKCPDNLTKLVSINNIPAMNLSQDDLWKFAIANLIPYRNKKKKELADAIAEEKLNPTPEKVVEKKKPKKNKVNHLKYVVSRT